MAALPSRRLKKLPHKPRSAIGTTGTGPPLEDPLDAFLEFVHLAVAREFAFRKDAHDLAVGEFGVDAVEGLRRSAFGSSRAGAIGIACAVRKMKPSTGILKML